MPQLTEPLWTDSGLKSGIDVRELISTLKKTHTQAGHESSNLPPKSLQARGKGHHDIYMCVLFVRMISASTLSFLVT